MAPAINNTVSGTQLKPFTPEDDANLREALKRCSAATYEAAAQFRKTGNTEHLPAIVLGIIERYVEPDLRAKLKDADDASWLLDNATIVYLSEVIKPKVLFSFRYLNRTAGPTGHVFEGRTFLSFVPAQGSNLAFAAFLDSLRNGKDLDRAISDTYPGRFRGQADLEQLWISTI